MSDPSMTGEPVAWLIQRLADDGRPMSQSLRFYEEQASNTVIVTALVPASLITKQADEIEAMNAKLTGIATCACSYDALGEVCAHHSPALLASQTSHAAARENFLTMQGAAATLLTRAETAEARIAVLEAAMRPFAKLGDEAEWLDKPDERPAWGFDGVDLTWGNFRAARNALVTP